MSEAENVILENTLERKCQYNYLKSKKWLTPNQTHL